MRVLILCNLTDIFVRHEAFAMAAALAEANAQVAVMSLAKELVTDDFVMPARVQVYQPFVGGFAQGIVGLTQLLFEMRPDTVHVLEPAYLGMVAHAQIVLTALSGLRHPFELFVSVKEAPGLFLEPLLIQSRALLVPTKLLQHAISSARSRLSVVVMPSFQFRRDATAAASAAARSKLVAVPGSPSDHEDFSGLVSELAHALSAHPTYGLCLFDQNSELVGEARLQLMRQLKPFGLDKRCQILSGARLETHQDIIHQAALVCLAPLLLSHSLYTAYVAAAIASQTPLVLNSLQSEMDYYQWPVNEGAATPFVVARQKGALYQALSRLLERDRICAEWSEVWMMCRERTKDPTNELLRIYSGSVAG